MSVASGSSGKEKKVLRLFVAIQLCVFSALVIGSFYSCARTVETDVIHDTDTLVTHDTDTINFDGLAWVRFINLLTRGGVILIKTELGTSVAPFDNATQIMGKQFTPLHGDSALVLYTEYYIGPELRFDSLTIPADSLKPMSLNTIALFQVDQDGTTRIAPFFANDSMRKIPPPNGKTYLRFINGVADHPQPTPSVNLYLDDAQGKPLFLDNTGTTSRSVNFLELRNYILIPSGTHTIYVRKDGDPTILYQIQKPFRAGSYYTVKTTGSKTDGNDQISVDEE